MLHIFKPGTHTAMNGLTLSFSEMDVKQIAESYDKENNPAPLVVGHPKTDAPAYGWVDSLEYREDGLYASHEKVEAEFANMVNEGRFRNISISVYPPSGQGNPSPGNYYLQHVGFLGAVPPAVKGLKPASFSENDGAVTLEFALADADPKTAKLDNPPVKFQFTTEETIDMSGSNNATGAQVIDLTTLSTALADNAELKRKLAEMEAKQTNSAQFAEQEQALADQKAEMDRQKAELDNRLAFAAESLKQQRLQGVQAFATEMRDAGKLLPKDLNGMVAFMASIPDNEQIQFADGATGVTTQAGSLKWFQDWFRENSQQKVDFAETTQVDQFGHAVSTSTGAQANAELAFAAGVPVGTQMDKGQAALHQKAIAYCQAHNMDPNVSDDLFRAIAIIQQTSVR